MKGSSTKAAIVIKRLASIILIMLSLNLFSLNMGYASPIFMRACGMVCLAGLMIVYINSYKKIRIETISLAGASITLLSFTALAGTDRPEFWILSMIMFICGLDLLLRSAGEDEPQFSALALGSLFYFTFYIYYINDPFFWEFFTSLSQAASSILGRIAGTAVIFGPTISGAFIFLSFLCCAASFLILSKKMSPRPIVKLIVVLIGFAIAYAAYILTAISFWTDADSYIDRIYLAFFVLLIAFLIFASKMRISSLELGGRVHSPAKGAMPAALLFSVFIAVLLIAIVPITSTNNSDSDSGGIGKVVLYEKDSEMGFDIPHFPRANQSFAPDDGFSVGAIKRYLENMGGEVQSLNSTSPGELKDALKGANILMIMNLKKEFSSADRDGIRDYVKNGGGLLIFAEHTSMFVQDRDFAAGRDYLNDLLEPTGIKINPDTADYVPDHWLYAVSALHHPITSDLNFDLTTSSVGASLHLSGSARPLIIGRFAFSDSADPTAPGHLGDRLYEPGEALGDLVIAACDTYGKGKVLVFGDTSCIFNNELPFRYQLIYNSASWLTGRRSDLEDYQYLTSALILLLGLAAYFFAGRTLAGRTFAGHIFAGRAVSGNTTIEKNFDVDQPRLSLLLLICLALAAALSLGLASSINDSRTPALQAPQEDVAWIDFTHLNQFNSENYRDDGVAGLTENLFRNGYLPQILQRDQDISRLLSGSAAIIIAPNEDYSAREAQEIHQFVNSGGLLILCAGYKGAGPLSPILKSFGLEIADTPLGSFPWIEETHATGGQATVSPENLRRYWHKPKFMEAYPVLADGDYTPIAWMRYNGALYNLIIQKKAGLGNVVLIGDSRFLLNENLEHLSQGAGKENREQYQLQWLGNIELLRKILAAWGTGMI